MIHKLCARLGHPFRRPLEGLFRGYYICGVCGEVIREEDNQEDYYELEI